MKQFSVLFISLLFPFFLSGQNTIDSLEKELKGDITDSTKALIHLQLANQYLFVDFTRSQTYAEVALDIAESNNWPWAKVKVYNHLGYFHTLIGDYSTALKYDNLALQSAQQMKDSISIARAYSNIGNDYFDIGEYDEAYFHFTQAFLLGKAVNDSLRMSISLHNVGRVFKELGQYDQALSYINLAQSISEKINNRAGDAYYYNELGDLKMKQQDYDSALALLYKSLTATRSEKIHHLEARVLTKIARVYLEQNDYARAFAYYDSTHTLHRKTNNQFGLAEVDLGRGLVYLNQKKFLEARNLIERSLATARKLNARIMEIECNRYLYQIMEQRGNYEEALSYFKQYKILEDSLFSQEMQQKLYRDQIRFETEAKDSQIAMLSESEARQKDALKREEFIRNILVVVFALSVILLVTVYRSGQRRKQINSLLLKHQEEMEKRSEELERLNQVKDKFFSIISHDLRSPLNALAGILDLMSKGAVKPEDFEELTKELRIRFNHTRTLLNNLLDWTLLQMDKLSLQPARINLHKIIEENISLLSSLQTKKIRMTNLVNDNAIGFADSNTINLVIRNLMTNAIKFTNDGGEVTIDAKEKEHEWLLSVHDNGIGIKPEVQQILFDKTAPYTTRGTANEKGTGLGLILCKEFVEKNGGKIWVESSEGGGSTFWFTVPKGNPLFP